MAIKNTDKPENQGLRPFLRENFGPSAGGKSFVRNMASNTTHHISGGFSDKRESSEGIASRGLRTLMGIGIVAGMTSLFADLGHELYHMGFEGSVENDAAFHGDLLTSMNDTSGYVIVQMGEDDEAIMLYKADDGTYTMFEGHEVSDQDWQFDTITDMNHAAYLSLTIANDLREHATFPLITDAPYLMSFEGVSSPIIDKTGTIYRAADNVITSVLGADTANDAGEESTVNMEAVTASFPEPDLTLLFERASVALQNGAMHADVPPQFIENPILSPAENPQKEFDVFLAALVGWAGLGLVGGALGANAASRRRFKAENNKKLNPS